MQFENYSSTFVEESEGEFELMLSAARTRPLQLDGPVSAGNWNTQTHHKSMLWACVQSASVH